MKFRTVIEAAGKTAAGLPVPEDILTALGAGKKPAVTVTVGTHTYRSTIGSRGGTFLIPISVENRHLAGVAAGDEVDVDVELDTAPREVEVPADLAEALSRDPLARSEFDQLSYSNKQRHVLPILAAKTAQTRERRVENVVQTLHDAASPPRL